MRRLLLQAALAGSACIMLAGAAAPAGAAGSAIRMVAHPAGTAVPENGQVTRTSLSLNVTHSDFDREANVTASWTVFVASSLGPVPGGVVTIRTFLANGTRVDLCSGQVSPGGTGSCNLTNGRLLPGSYQFTAHYSGIVGFDEASDSAPKPLTVTGEPTSLFVGLATSTLAYGQEAVPNEFSFQVIPRTSGTPVGQVGVTLANQAGLCDGTLAGGSATCTLAAGQIAPGTYQIFGFYDGDSTYAFSTSPLQTLTITPGVTDTTLALSSPTIAFSSQQNEVLTAEVIPAGGIPTGSVAFKVGTSTICSASLVNGVAHCALSAGQLPAGSHQIIAVYSGDANFGAAFSSAQTLTVTG